MDLSWALGLGPMVDWGFPVDFIGLAGFTLEEILRSFQNRHAKTDEIWQYAQNASAEIRIHPEDVVALAFETAGNLCGDPAGSGSSMHIPRPDMVKAGKRRNP